MKRWMGAVAVLLLLSTGTACGIITSKTSSSGGTKTLTVYAASSLTSTFTELGKKFEAAHHGVKVKFSFAGSSDLVAQLQQGAHAGVFASADTANMDKASTDKLIAGTPVNFATNTLEIVVPPDNPAKVTSLKDLARSTTKVVVCAPEVPCGAAARKVEASSKVRIKPVSEEQSVTDVLNKVETGEADAGLVYVTDVKAAGDKVKGITFPESSTAVNTYPIAALAQARHKALAKEFIALVTGADGQQILAAAGFAQP